ncbi:MAG: hypothetical protein JSU07_04285 [Bacteroidetes bacterium]|nr:hypothetical protein [Bacteroidota bacterium]
MFKKNIIYLTVTFIFVLLYNQGFSQCAMCKATAESTLKSDPTSMVRSLNSGILYLMSVPYILLAIVFRKQLASVWRKLVVSKFTRKKTI